MTAIPVDTRVKVDALYARALKASGSDEGAPACAARKARRLLRRLLPRSDNRAVAFRIGPA